jgi:hypothetical protein
VRVERLQPGSDAPAHLVGGVLARNIKVDGERWSKGRRLSTDDVARLAGADPATIGAAVSIIIIDEGELHEDEAGLRLADVVRGPGLTVRGPNESRVDLLAAHDGVLHVRIAELELLNRIDPLEVFTAFDGSVVREGDLVASIKVAPHVVAESVLEEGIRVAMSADGPLVRVAPFVPHRVAVLVLESLHTPARSRFEASVRDKIESLGSALVSIEYLEDGEAVEAAYRRLTSGPEPVDLVLTAGGGSTDPLDPFVVGLESLGGEMLRHGVPAHPGSMVWLGRIRDTAVLGLPTCGAYSKATAADLVLPRLLTGEEPGPRLVSPLGHGGILTRHMRFRFPPYARELDAPEG